MEKLSGTIIEYNMLTPRRLEMVIKIPKTFSYQPGQWVLLDFHDDQGDFKRAYSLVDYVAEKNHCEITLFIKLLDQGRGAEVLEGLKKGSQIGIGGIFGKFILQDTPAPKVFIGTGTGIAAILNMAKLTSAKNKMLIFSVSYKSDLFYEDRIKSIPGLDYKIHITREDIPGYPTGRFDLSTFTFATDTEFYICGNPKMVKFNTEKLKEWGFEKIYSEQY